MTLPFIGFSLGTPLGPVNTLLFVGVRGEFVRQIFVNGRPDKFSLVSKLMASTRLETNSVPDSRATLTFSYDFCLRASDA